MARLERLSLEQSDVDTETMRLLGNSPHLKRLKELDLGGCTLEQGGGRVLLTGPAFAGLERLYLAELYGPQDDPPEEELLARFGPGVLDFDSDSHCRWRENGT
jgi:hypothetical protein